MNIYCTTAWARGSTEWDFFPHVRLRGIRVANIQAVSWKNRGEVSPALLEMARGGGRTPPEDLPRDGRGCSEGTGLLPVGPASLVVALEAGRRTEKGEEGRAATGPLGRSRHFLPNSGGQMSPEHLSALDPWPASRLPTSAGIQDLLRG